MMIRAGNASHSSIIHAFLSAIKFTFQSLDWVPEKVKMGNVWSSRGPYDLRGKHRPCGRQAWWDQGAGNIRSSL